jgi:hypothetical protein
MDILLTGMAGEVVNGRHGVVTVKQVIIKVGKEMLV